MSAATAQSPTPPSTAATVTTRWRVLGELVAVSVILVACLPLLWPLMQTGTPATHDGFLHVQRLIALDAAARDGAPFSRWLPDLAYGHGQPLLLYYAPLSYVPALALRLLGLGFVASLELTSGLALVLSGLSMYLLGRSLCGRVASATAAIVYMALPYQLVDLYVRGVLAETWSFVWLPLAALGLIRTWKTSSWLWVTATAAALAGLILTHNVTALLYLPGLVVLAAVLQIARGRTSLFFATQAAVALLFGVGLAAWFWLPALAERALVQIEQTIEPKLFASFFLDGWPPFHLEWAFDYQQPVSTALGYPIFWPQLGLVQVVISVAGAVAVVRLSGVRRVVGVWALLLVVGGFVLQTRPFAVIYEVVPLLAFVQFPWRLLAIVGLGSALLSALAVDRIVSRAPDRILIAGTIVGASLLTAVANLNPEQIMVDERQLSTEMNIRSELAEYGLGSTHSGEYLPVSSGQRNATRLRKTILDAGSSRTVPEPIALTVERVEWQAGRILAEVTSTSATAEQLLFGQFAFDGWGMKVDGQTVRTLSLGQLGLAGVSLTPGKHTVELSWTGTRTSARQMGISVAAVSLAVLVFILAGGRLRGRTRWLAGAGVALLVAAGSSGWTIPAFKSFVTTAQAAPTAETARWQPLDDTLALADVRHDTSRLAAERLVTTRLIWLVRRAPTTSYRGFVEATAADGTVHRAPWVYEPLSRLWERGQLTATTVAVRLPPGFPAGPAALRLVFERPAGLEPVALGNVNVPASQDDFSRRSLLTTVRIEPADITLSIPENSTITTRTGAAHDLRLRWSLEAEAPNVERELLVRAVLLDTNGRATVVSDVRRPGDWFAPLPFWQQGDLIEQRLRMTVPSTVAPGSYPLWLEVFGRDLERGGIAEPGASENQPGKQPPLTTVQLGTMVVEP